MAHAPKREVIDALDAFVQGEYMAIESYSNFISKVQNRTIREELKHIQLDHKKHAANLGNRAQELNRRPTRATGYREVMEDKTFQAQTLSNQTDLDILKRAYDIESIGVEDAGKIIQGNLDSDSEELMRQALTSEQEHLRRLEDLIIEYENSN